MSDLIEKDSFDGADTSTKLSILFDYQKNTRKILKLLGQHPTGCEARFKKIEKKAFFSMIITPPAAFLGGFAAIVAKLKWWSG